jgi:hypothetical protein
METKILIMVKTIIKGKSHKDQEIQLKWKEFLNIKILLKFHNKNQKIVQVKINQG